uniref:Uncharacterized protein n=1 Tax=Arundo donax TaxID=35708 RepID=A0A0A9GTI1_ARUDO
MPCPDRYRLATRYIDDKLQNLINSSDDIRQMEWTLVHTG